MRIRARVLRLVRWLGHDEIDSLPDEYTDARFEVLGTPFSLLSASISASQNLYTRKGTLVGFNGKPENVRNFHLNQPIF